VSESARWTEALLFGAVVGLSVMAVGLLCIGIWTAIADCVDNIKFARAERRIMGRRRR